MPLTKSIFRKNCIKKIKNTPKESRYYRNAMINRRLMFELKNVKNAKILFYYPLEFEADIRKALNKMRKNCEILIPFMQDSSFKIVPFRLPLKRKNFGIYEAGNTIKNINKIDIAIVPAVGVATSKDGRLQRVGFGKGMYDRFFAKLKKRPYTIFIQPEICFTKEDICDSYDIACDLLLTPKIAIRPKRYVG
ncbi:5-formyltetrahydrofolate cyclo-ligase [Sulfurimonas sp.]|uniref:5-formyltetrahydrofolate cyclo-ligase n=1 Tax=Sulfurimonas sp. TaxID=2022749 RepID=UPI002B4980EA|nr:5-formyltetrahydrofolate cyclo-ligase [Sulfurimonas sp.]